MIKSPVSAESQFIGTAQVAGELWTVKSDEPLSVGTPVVVVHVEGLTLFVRALAYQPASSPEKKEEITNG